MRVKVIQKESKSDIDNLKKLIDRYNLLPSKIDLAPLRVSSENANNWFDSGNQYSKWQKPYEKWTESAHNSLSENLKGLNERFTNYIWGDARLNKDIFFESYEPDFDIKNLWHSTLQAVIRYEDFLQLRDQFKLLVDFVFKHPSWLLQFTKSSNTIETKKLRFVLEKFEKSKMPEEDFPPPLLGSVRFKVDENGTINSELDEFSKAINEVDIRRVRECLNVKCLRIFWAGRIDKFCCSSECNNVLNTRLIRSENLSSEERESRNLQKHQNRKFKQKKI